MEPALRDDKAERVAQWEGSQHHIARRVREEGQSVKQVNAAEGVCKTEQEADTGSTDRARGGHGINRCVDRWIRGSNGGELQKTGKRRTPGGNDVAEKLATLFLCLRSASSVSGGIWSCNSWRFRPPRSICSTQEEAAAASSSPVGCNPNGGARYAAYPSLTVRCLSASCVESDSLEVGQ